MPCSLSTRCLVAAAFVAASVQNARADVFVQTYEAPGVVHTTATFIGGSGVETFDGRGNGGFVSTFGASAYSGTYSASTQVNGADIFGGAGGTGRYAVTFSSSGYSIAINTPITYFGYWLSALDSGNVVEFYNGTTLVGSLGASAVLASIGNKPAYFGNPSPAFLGADGIQPYAFVNFFDTSGHFDRIVFREDPTIGGYESDNHTVGVYATISGVPVVPEPSACALMLFGLGSLVLLRRRRVR